MCPDESLLIVKKGTNCHLARTRDMSEHRRKVEKTQSGQIHKLTLYQEAKKWREDFRWSRFFQMFILGFALSLVDSVSDFNFASKAEVECAELTWAPDKENRTQMEVWYQRRVNNTCTGIPPYYVQSLTYFFVSLAGILFLLDSLKKLICRWISENLKPRQSIEAAIYGLSFLFLAASLAGSFFLIVMIPIWKETFPWPGFILAILTTIGMLGVKAIALFVHGQEMRRLAVKVTCMESQHESALQLLLLFWIGIYGHPSTSSIFAIVSSILVIGKAGAEAFLTFGKENKLEETGSLLRKLSLLVTYSPVFMLTAVFRIGTLALLPVWGGGAWGDGKRGALTGLEPLILVLAAALTLPLATLHILRCRGRMEDMESGSLLQGTISELATISLWGGRGRDGSKKISLAFATFLFLLFSFVLMRIIMFPGERGLGGPAEEYLGKQWLAGQEKRVVGAAGVFLSCGCLSLPLHIGQLYLFDKPRSTNMENQTTQVPHAADAFAIII